MPTISAVATAIAVTMTEVRPSDAASPRAAMRGTAPNRVASHRSHSASTAVDIRGEINAAAPIRQTSAAYPPTGIRSAGGTREHTAASTASATAAAVSRGLAAWTR